MDNKELTKFKESINFRTVPCCNYCTHCLVEFDHEEYYCIRLKESKFSIEEDTVCDEYEEWDLGE